MEEEKSLCKCDEGVSYVQKVYDNAEGNLPKEIVDTYALAGKSYKRMEEIKVHIAEVLGKANESLEKVDELGVKVKEAGKHKAKNGLLGKPTKNTKIEAIQENIRDVLACEETSAEALKEFANILLGLMDMTESITEVLNEQMVYQGNIAKTMEILFGLSARSIAESESLVERVKLILNDATEDEIGEVERQALYQVLEQIKHRAGLENRISALDESSKKEKWVRYLLFGGIGISWLLNIIQFFI